mgnify:FL=1
MEKMMKAARMHRIGEFSVESVPIPIPHGDELLVRIGACGVCGSDMPRIYVNGTSKQKYPLILGHEFSGTVVAVGETADPAYIGKRGTFFPLIPCRKCDSCLSGNYAMCEDYDYLGSRRDGGFAEYCLIPSAWHMVCSQNPDTSFEELAMVEPACVAQHAMLRRSGMYAGANVLIFGAGPIGIMAARWAKLAGAGHILMVDVLDEKVAFAEKHGFSAVNSTSCDLEQAVRAAFGGKLADIAFEGTGFGSALNNAIDCVKAFGTIVMVGNPAGDTTINKGQHSKILRKELTLNGIWNSHFSNSPINEWRYTVDMMDKGLFHCEDLISQRTDLDGLPGLIDDVKNHRVNSCKIMFVGDKE